MRIMIDTTVFLAECLLPEQKYPMLFRKIVAEDRLVLPKKQIEEIRGIMKEFFPEECDTVELFLERFSYETPEESPESSGEGYPFLADAKASGVETVVTLDPQMAGAQIDGIRFISADEYLGGDRIG